MIEQLYQDFTTKLLPKIHEGLVISQDYFMDLFGRYIHYLIITDIIQIGIGLFLMVGTIWGGKKLWKLDDGRADELTVGITLMLWVFFFIGFVMLIGSSFDLVKDLYIPEVRIIEILSSSINQK